MTVAYFGTIMARVSAEMGTPAHMDVIRLVLGVARLGDVDLLGWWHSHSYTPAGNYVLGNALPRTWLLSALEGSVLSAAARHREAFSRPTAVHLFSGHLPALNWALGWLRAQKVAGEANGLIDELRVWDRASGPRTLAAWAGVASPRGEILVQERRLGTLHRGDLARPEERERVIRILAACYADQGEDLRFPCFELIPEAPSRLGS